MNVVRAFEVPVRVDVDPLLDNDLSLVPVRPFVEVSFQGQKKRTTTAVGANPTWNQDLRIPVKYVIYVQKLTSLSYLQPSKTCLFKNEVDTF